MRSDSLQIWESHIQLRKEKPSKWKLLFRKVETHWAVCAMEALAGRDWRNSSHPPSSPPTLMMTSLMVRHLDQARQSSLSWATSTARFKAFNIRCKRTSFEELTKTSVNRWWILPRHILALALLPAHSSTLTQWKRLLKIQNRPKAFSKWKNSLMWKVVWVLRTRTTSLSLEEHQRWELQLDPIQFDETLKKKIAYCFCLIYFIDLNICQKILLLTLLRPYSKSYQILQIILI